MPNCNSKKEKNLQVARYIHCIAHYNFSHLKKLTVRSDIKVISTSTSEQKPVMNIQTFFYKSASSTTRERNKSIKIKASNITKTILSFTTESRFYINLIYKNIEIMHHAFLRL